MRTKTIDLHSYKTEGISNDVCIHQKLKPLALCNVRGEKMLTEILAKSIISLLKYVGLVLPNA